MTMTSEAMKMELSASLDEESADYVIDRIDWYREVLREDPASGLFCELAEELCAEGLWEEAIRALREGLRFHPGHIRGHALLGWAHWEYGAAEQAEGVLEQVRSELRKSAIVYRVLGEISTHRGDLDEAASLETIHSLMRRGMEAPEAPWDAAAPPPARPVSRAPRGDAEAREPVHACEPAESPLLSFLGALKVRARAAAPLEGRAVAVFTAEDRKALERLIHAHTGAL
jgi:hypothetical protein